MEGQMTNEVKQLITKDLIFGNAVAQWAQAAIVFAIVFVILAFVKIFFSRKYKKLKISPSERLTFRVVIYSFLKKINLSLVFIFALYPAFDVLSMPQRADQIAKYIFVVALFAQFLIWANYALNLYSANYVRKNLQKDPTSLTAIHIFTLIWKVTVFGLLFLIMLDQLGFNITTLLAGLGVGGIAIAFALQNILGDVFGSLAIILDKPFKVGDIVRFNNFTGRIEKVGLKTTRLRSLDGELLIYSNSEILKTVIQNFGDIHERRKIVSLGVTYESGYEKLKIIPELVKKAIFSQPGTTLQIVVLKEFGESSINFEGRYFIQEQEDGNSPKIEHNINMEIMRLFDEEGISFAYPTRTVYTKTL